MDLIVVQLRSNTANHKLDNNNTLDRHNTLNLY